MSAPYVMFAVFASRSDDQIPGPHKMCGEPFSSLEQAKEWLGSGGNDTLIYGVKYEIRKLFVWVEEVVATVQEV